MKVEVECSMEREVPRPRVGVGVGVESGTSAVLRALTRQSLQVS